MIPFREALRGWLARLILSLNRAASWISLSRLRNSFASKAFTALSFSSLALANIPDFAIYVGVDAGAFRMLLVGSLVFISGYVLFAIKVPAEFSHDGEIYDHVGRMMALADDRFVSSRLALASKLATSTALTGAFGPSAALVKYLEEQVVAAAVNCSTVSGRAGLFHSDLLVRQYASPLSRLAVFALLTGGAVIIAAPTILNVLRALN